MKDKLFLRIAIFGGVILLLGTQIYGYTKYSLSPFNQLFLLTHLQSKFLLQSTNVIGNTDPLDSIAISPDGNTLASASSNSVEVLVNKNNVSGWITSIKIWNLRTGELKSTLTGNPGFNALAISPDGNTLISGDRDTTIKIWNLQTGKLKSTLTSHSEGVYSLVISPDGNTLVSGSWDTTIKIWNLQTGKLKSTLIGHSGLLHPLFITSDGKTVISASSLSAGDTDAMTIKTWRLE
ncbi:hypothetical protein A0J48_009445 [Sphaerospermopsis aphanizomenoides BCCUSP55]|uniref:WD40 repeat domain-containing protein n=1 Tax=Sphaerospermopsis aphanizomenoides TaxID=459663 RepID=UPI0019084EBD|nr:hypothetical protein [Sphaerospermopsis aphanizomenoides]MBK1987758.1 hypothetical protein [Sphaerospermopsis aphanizomenoides BCCUSP55]